MEIRNKEKNIIKKGKKYILILHRNTLDKKGLKMKLTIMHIFWEKLTKKSVV